MSITAENYPLHAGRTEQVPTADIVLGISEAQTLTLLLKQAIGVSEDIDKLKRHLFYGKKINLLDVLPDSLGEVKLGWSPKTLTPEQYRLLHSALGLLTEAGEYAQTVLEHVLEGQPLDQVNLKAECGDNFWYLAIPANLFQWKFEEIMDSNIRKLRVRYPDKWNQEDALNRDLEKERAEVEGTASPS